MEKLVESVKREFIILADRGVLRPEIEEEIDRVTLPWEFLDITDRLRDYLIGGEYDVPQILRGFVFIDDTDGAVYISDTANIGPFVHIEGPAIIGPGCNIHDCLVESGTILFGKNHIGKATEIKNAILLCGSNAAHQNYVGDSVVGAGCNLGAGTKIGNLRLDKRDVIVCHNGERHETHRRKFGAVLEDGVQTGCNSDINPGTYITKDSFIYPVESVHGFVDRSANRSKK